MRSHSKIMNYVELSNIKTLEFNRNSKQRMEEILQPLKQYGIIAVTFMRTFLDGKRHYLSSDIGWVEKYLNHNLIDNVDHMEHYLAPTHTRYALWNSLNQDEVFDFLATIGHGNGFSIYEHHDTYVNQFDFTSSPDNPGINEFYIKNIPLFEEHINNFKQQGSDLIGLENNDRFFIPKKKFDFKKMQLNNFIQKENIDKFMDCISINRGRKFFLYNSLKQSLFPFSAKSI